VGAARPYGGCANEEDRLFRPDGCKNTEIHLALNSTNYALDDTLVICQGSRHGQLFACNEN
ncbi:hypothetical protein QT970_23360, partial [Microcoleus sp. herbarium8]|uniref:hypothetical protein n=1 Tax=Microcoleus sp. herbarium8 TaxID=3055436 RepID=UPI002FD364CB